jgi:hypothetical protein
MAIQLGLYSLAARTFLKQLQANSMSLFWILLHPAHLALMLAPGDCMVVEDLVKALHLFLVIRFGSWLMWWMAKELNWLGPCQTSV